MRTLWCWLIALLRLCLPTHALLVVPAVVIVGLWSPPPACAGLACFFSVKNRNQQLWVPATKTEDEAVYDNNRDCYYKPYPATRDAYGFLFLTYEPSSWWWESKELLRKFIFCGVSCVRD